MWHRDHGRVRGAGRRHRVHRVLRRLLPLPRSVQQASRAKRSLAYTWHYTPGIHVAYTLAL